MSDDWVLLEVAPGWRANQDDPPPRTTQGAYVEIRGVAEPVTDEATGPIAFLPEDMKPEQTISPGALHTEDAGETLTVLRPPYTILPDGRIIGPAVE